MNLRDYLERQLEVLSYCKRKNQVKNKAFFVVLALIFVSGCAWGDRMIRLSYSPVSSIQPKNNIVVKVNNFEDKRTITDTVGYSRNAYGMRCAKVIPENSVSEWVTNALKAELVNLGYTISDQETTTNVINGVVFDVFCDTYFTYDGRVGIKVILEKNGKIALERNYSANKTGGVNWAATSTSFAKTLEMALQDTLRQVVVDINDQLLKKTNESQ